jgi:hypothetical protein
LPTKSPLLATWAATSALAVLLGSGCSTHWHAGAGPAIDDQGQLGIIVTAEIATGPARLGRNAVTLQGSAGAAAAYTKTPRWAATGGLSLLALQRADLLRFGGGLGVIGESGSSAVGPALWVGWERILGLRFQASPLGSYQIATGYTVGGTLQCTLGSGAGGKSLLCGLPVTFGSVRMGTDKSESPRDLIPIH